MESSNSVEVTIPTLTDTWSVWGSAGTVLIVLTLICSSLAIVICMGWRVSWEKKKMVVACALLAAMTVLTLGAMCISVSKTSKSENMDTFARGVKNAQLGAMESKFGFIPTEAAESFRSDPLSKATPILIRDTDGKEWICTVLPGNISPGERYVTTLDKCRVMK